MFFETHLYFTFFLLFHFSQLPLEGFHKSAAFFLPVKLHKIINLYIVRSEWVILMPGTSTNYPRLTTSSVTLASI